MMQSTSKSYFEARLGGMYVFFSLLLLTFFALIIELLRKTVLLVDID
jgi:hypothetical protein